MDFQNDPELEKLFRDELDERAASLAEGARSMASGDVNTELAGRMLREGHTIKGTGRVMGYEGIARGGETCELVWRWVQQGEIAPSSMLGRTLEHLADAIPGALGGDEGPVSIAIDTVGALITDETLAAQLPTPTVPVNAPSDSSPTIDDDVPAPEPEAKAADPETPSKTIDLAAAEQDSGQTAGDDLGLDAEDMADVAATLDQIELEVAQADGRAPETAAPQSAETAVADDAVEPDTTHEAEADDQNEAASDDGVDLPLVFEPGPDGKLPTPVITYEIVKSAFESDDSPAEPPPAPSEPASEVPEVTANLSLVETGPSVLDPDNSAVYDLGGLLGAVEMWAAEESVPVNAGRLFRMINDVAALRIDLESAIGQAGHIMQASEGGAPGSAVESAMESLETVRRASVNLESAALGLTMVPLAGVTATLPQLTKYLSKKTDRDIELIVEGEETVVDRQLADRIGEIIRQLVVNAIAHGIESKDARLAAGKAAHGTVKLALSRSENHLKITVADDGGGVDWPHVRAMAVEQDLVGDDPSTDDLRSVLFSDGFSTDPGSSEFSGDGDGLARVTSIVEQVFGTMTLDSVQGKGTTFEVTMPAHRALQRAQIFGAGGRTWGIPDSSVLEVLAIPDVSIMVNERGSFISYHEKPIPYSSFATVVGLDVEGLPSEVMVVQSPTGPIALAVDEVSITHEVATKDLSPLLSGSSSVVSGVALLGGDDTVMLVDAGRLAERMRETEARPNGPVHTVLVVDDSQGVRQVVSGVLASHGFSTVAAGSVSDALAALAKHTVDALVVDFSMPRADGVALIHMVRQRYGDIPVVMLSGVASDEDRSRAERAGVHAFFDKADFAKGALVEKLRELIDGESATNSSSEIAS